MPTLTPTIKTVLFTLCICLLAGCSPSAAPSTATAEVVPTSQASATPSTDCAAGEHVNTFETNSAIRTYRLYVPHSYQPNHPIPLVLGFHGNTGHADQFEASSGFSVLAEHANFIAVYVQGAGNPPTWNTWESSNDVAYVNDLLDYIQLICNIDPARIYAVGHSLGGGMIHRLACDLADRIAAIGPVSGAYQNSEPCTPSQPVAVVSIHGTADSIVYYNGVPPYGDTPGAYFTISTPIPQWASKWAKMNGCDGKATVIFKKDPVSGQQWSHCRSNADVTLYTIRDGGHGWPNPKDGFDAAQTIWDFFVKHPHTQ